MLESRVARGLMLLGVGIGVLSVAVAALDIQLNLPDWMIRVAMIKLAFVASAGLLAGGAMVGRHAKARGLTPSAPELLPHERAESFGQPFKGRAPDEIELGARGGPEPDGRRRTDERGS
jgi:hypothetical protein